MTKLPIPAAALDAHAITLGKTGAGKSSALRLIVEHLLDQERPVCIIDPKGDWWGLKSTASGKGAGYPVVIFGGDHADVPINEHSGAAVAELVATGNRPTLIDLGGWMVGARTRFFIEFASAFFRHARGARHLVIDECHNFAPQGKIQDVDAGKMLHWANRLASEGRGKGITLLAASQRPQKVHKDFVTSCETLIAMRVIHPLDRGAVEDWMQGAGDKALAKELVAQLAAMKRGEAWVWSPEIAFGPERVTFPMFRTFDSFKPQASAVAPEGWAKVDLEEVKGRLATAIAEAEANDPKKLKERIRQLEKANAAHPMIALDRADELVRETEQRVREELEGLAEHRAAEAAAAAVAELRIIVRPHVEALHHALANGSSAGFPTSSEAPKPAHRAPAAPARAARPATRPTPAPKRAPMEGGSLTGARLKVARALSELEAIGVGQATRSQLGFYVGMVFSAGYGARTLGEMRTVGLIDYPADGFVALTNAGRAAAGDVYAPLDLDELHARVRGHLTGLSQRVFDAIVELGEGGSLTRDELGALLGVTFSAGYGARTIGELHTAGIVSYPTKGSVGPSDLLFPAGLT